MRPSSPVCLCSFFLPLALVAAAPTPKPTGTAAVRRSAASTSGSSTSQGFSLGFSQKRVPSRHGSLSKRALNARQSADDAQSPLLNLDDARYIVEVTLAGQQLDFIIDTGSTDTFVYSVQPSNQIGDAEPTLFENSTATFVSTGLTYNASYGSGNGVSTTLGTVHLGDITFENTDLSARNLSFADIYRTDNGVGASGLLGLGFPLNGNIWSEAVIARYQQTKEAVSSAFSSSFFPVVPLLQSEGDIPNAIFSLVVSRIGPQGANNPKTSGGTLPTSPQATLSNGTITFGAYPSGMQESDFVWSPVPVVTVSQQYQSYGFPSSMGNRWTTQLEAIYFNGAKLVDSKIQPNQDSNYALIDTGNPIMALANDVLAQITNAWAGNPSNYVIPCDTPFELVFQFAGQNFTLNKEDVLVPSTAAIDSANYGGYATTDCQAQMQPFTPTSNEIGPNTSQTHQLGDVFLRNVISVFDYGSLQNAASNPPRIGFYSTTPASS